MLELLGSILLLIACIAFSMISDSVSERIQKERNERLRVEELKFKRFAKERDERIRREEAEHKRFADELAERKLETKETKRKTKQR